MKNERKKKNFKFIENIPFQTGNRLVDAGSDSSGTGMYLHFNTLVPVISVLACVPNRYTHFSSVLRIWTIFIRIWFRLFKIFGLGS
jgi:hypothetical protein